MPEVWLGTENVAKQMPMAAQSPREGAAHLPSSLKAGSRYYHLGTRWDVSSLFFFTPLLLPFPSVVVSSFFPSFPLFLVLFISQAGPCAYLNAATVSTHIMGPGPCQDHLLLQTLGD